MSFCLTYYLSYLIDSPTSIIHHLLFLIYYIFVIYCYDIYILFLCHELSQKTLFPGHQSLFPGSQWRNRHFHSWTLCYQRHEGPQRTKVMRGPILVKRFPWAKFTFAMFRERKSLVKKRLEVEFLLQVS